MAVEQSETKSVAIFLYHHVQELPDGAGSSLRKWTLTPEKFEAQFNWFAEHGFHSVTMAQLVALLKHGQPLPLNPFVLSFDDGWKEHYTVVFPILMKHKFTGTFFITTDSVEHAAFVNWAELQEMSAAGMDIQAHSLTHPYLAKLPYEEAFREIAGSKEAIESHLNKPVIVFAYPFGSYNADVIKMVRRAGFEGAATVSGMNRGYIQPPNDPYTLIRFAVTGSAAVDDLAQRLF